MESDNRNCPESESELESDDETSDSTALMLTEFMIQLYTLFKCTFKLGPCGVNMLQAPRYQNPALVMQ